MFSREKERKIHIHQRAFKVSVGDPLAQYWCIDFGLLLRVPELNPFFCKSRFGALCKFEANRSNVMKIGSFQQDTIYKEYLNQRGT